MTYWDGAPLTHFEQLCLRSFLARGHHVELASYGTPANVPAGVDLIDAREFLALDTTVARLLDASAYSKVSDILRYRLLADGTRTWVDVDVMLLADDVPQGAPLFGLEDDHHANGAILRLEPGSALLREVLQATGDLDPQQLLAGDWGAIGPLLLTRVVDELDLRSRAQPVEVLYPVRSRDLWRLFDPREVGWCERTLEGASTLHLWNEFLRRAGLRERAPARGSWLGRAMRTYGVVARGPRISVRWVRTEWRQQLPEPPPLAPRPTSRSVAGRLVRAFRRLRQR